MYPLQRGEAVVILVKVDPRDKDSYIKDEHNW